VVIVSVRPTLPDAPAVYVTVWVDAPPVITPFVIVHAYVDAPAAPLAVWPAELAHTCASAGVTAGTELAQSMTEEHAVTSLSVGVTVESVVERKALYCR
jgi:hypothetical protein